MPFAGSYFDGKTAARHDVSISLETAGLELRKLNGSAIVWPYWSIKGSAEGTGVRLQTNAEFPESVIVADPAFVLELRHKFPAVLESSASPTTHDALRLTGIAVVSLAAIGVLIWISLPWLGQWSASIVPQSFEEKLGAAVAESLAPQSKRCRDVQVNRVMNDILRELERVTPSPYKLRLYVADDPMVNAFAAPGGHIVIYRGLIGKTHTPEEVAGVLAHEIQHVVLRHTTRAMMRGFSMRILLALFLGDAGWLAQISGALGETHFLRQDEDSADREGMRTMQRARLDPQGMVRLLEILEKEAADAPDAIQYLSTHPQTKDRIREMRKLAEEARYVPRRLPVTGPWPPDMSSCQGGANPAR